MTKIVIGKMAWGVVPLGLAAFLIGAQEAPASAAGAPAAADSAEVELVIPSGEYRLEKNHAILQWSISHLGMSDYLAEFLDYDVTLMLDAADLERSSVTAVINADSIDTNHPGAYDAATRGFASWDKELGLAERFMDGARHPRITFQSTSVEKTGPRTATITGNLTFRGYTKPVTLNARFIGQNARHMSLGVPFVGFEAEGEILRADFGMGSDPLGTTARVYFNGELVGAANPQQ